MPPERPLARLLLATAGVAPVRFAFAAVGVVAAAFVGSGSGTALAFVLGAVAITVAVLADPRRRFFGELPADPLPPPAAAPREPWWRTVLAATVPSTLKARTTSPSLLSRFDREQTDGSDENDTA